MDGPVRRGRSTLTGDPSESRRTSSGVAADGCAETRVSASVSTRNSDVGFASTSVAVMPRAISSLPQASSGTLRPRIRARVLARNVVCTTLVADDQVGAATAREGPQVRRVRLQRAAVEADVADARVQRHELLSLDGERRLRLQDLQREPRDRPRSGQLAAALVVQRQVDAARPCVEPHQRGPRHRGGRVDLHPDLADRAFAEELDLERLAVLGREPGRGRVSVAGRDRSLGDVGRPLAVAERARRGPQQRRGVHGSPQRDGAADPVGVRERDREPPGQGVAVLAGRDEQRCRRAARSRRARRATRSGSRVMVIASTGMSVVGQRQVEVALGLDAGHPHLGQGEGAGQLQVAPGRARSGGSVAPAASTAYVRDAPGRGASTTQRRSPPSSKDSWSTGGRVAGHRTRRRT